MERYPSGSRGPSAKGLDCVSGARVRIPLSPPFKFVKYGPGKRSFLFVGNGEQDKLVHKKCTCTEQ